MDEDTIIKIVEVCEEPELVTWKIAKVRELLTHLSTSGNKMSDKRMVVDEGFEEKAIEAIRYARKILTQKRTVTREKVETLCLAINIVEHVEPKNIIKWLKKELGIEVITKK